ncbi:MAG: adenylate/guanylate cyclase domain-containing protein [Alphaproteobacteria bacterium]
MAEGGTERRLAAIVAIDVAGYSRLMGADEDGTLATMKAHREINFPIGEKHGGRVVGTAGDGVLWEFPSITEAVAASIEIQARMAEINADIPDDRKMLYRIGINLGDVMVDGDDIYGDGINVAARIEALATPGGICLSRAARDQVRDRMDINLEDMGEVEVKNIARPVRVFKVLADGQSAAVPAKTKPKWMIPVIAAAVLLVTIIGGGAWWWMLQPDFEPADPKKYAYRLPQAPSIAVLPFDYLGDDKKANEYLSDGLTENIIAVLATSPDLFVIARNSSFTYKGKPVKVQQVAENLGVRYVLEGSVQRFGDKLRVTAQLIDALNGKHLWAERYDRQLTDFLRIQDEIAQQILVQLHAKLSGGAGTIGVAKNFGQDMEGYRQFTIALKKFQSFTKKGHHEAIAIYQDLLQKNPKNFSVVGMMGWLQWQKALLGLSKNRSKTLREARKFAEKSLSLRENKDRAYSVYGLMAWLDLLELKHKGAIENAD